MAETKTSNMVAVPSPKSSYRSNSRKNSRRSLRQGPRPVLVAAAFTMILIVGWGGSFFLSRQISPLDDSDLSELADFEIESDELQISSSESGPLNESSAEKDSDRSPSRVSFNDVFQSALDDSQSISTASLNRSNSIPSDKEGGIDSTLMSPGLQSNETSETAWFLGTIEEEEPSTTIALPPPSADDGPTLR